MHLSLKDTVAVVTGGAKGTGQAIVRRFLEDGAHVMLADVDPIAGRAVEKELESVGTLRFVECDVGERLDVHNLIAATLDAFGRIDSLVNCAGVDHAADFLELTEADFDEVIRVNLKGTFLTCQAVARHMVQRIQEGGEPGCIVNLSSLSAILASPDRAAYAASKGGAAQFTRAAAVALGPYGIRVNAIGVGVIRSDMPIEVMGDVDAQKRKLARVPLGRFGEAEEIAAIAAFLVSPAASYVTGQTIYADGGILPFGTGLLVRPE